MKEVFTNIIKGGYWADVPCGTGSTMAYTQPLRDGLKEFLEKHNIKSMVDAPCGDYSWMSQTPLPEGIKYTGGDIVEHMVDANKNKYPGVEFACFDISTDALPDVDLLFCRDCLIHFSHADVIKTLKNIVSSNIQYILITSYDDEFADNKNIQTGDFRPISFTKSPYTLGDPIDKIFDWAPGTRNGGVTKHMILWHRSAIENFLNKQ